MTSTNLLNMFNILFLYIHRDLDWLLIFSYIPLSYSCIVDKDIILHILKLVYDCTLVLPNEEALRMINKCLIILIHFYRALAYLTIQAYDTLTTQVINVFTFFPFFISVG
jgi:hypothetical protein